MRRQFYLELARAGLRMPIGADLVLRERPEAEAILQDGRRLGRVLAETARRYRTPLAFGRMDLTLEKRVLLEALGVAAEAVDQYHFPDCPGSEAPARLERGLSEALGDRLQAQVDAVSYLATETDLVPVGMSIGPFSLMTKLVADPITAIYLAGAGVPAEEDADVARVEASLDLALRVVLRSVAAQVEAGAKAVFLAEPAASAVYVSPKQLAAGSDVFERYVLQTNRRVKALLDARGADLIFHCCGEVTDAMLTQFCSLDPAILSLGSSRKLWEDARLVPPETVLFGNLPSKHFYSDAVLTRTQVVAQACELLRRMAATGHAFILASECDILDVPGCTATIADKVEAFLTCRCDAAPS